MRLWRKQETPVNESPEHDDRHVRLVDAEKRANAVFEKAVWLRAAVISRDTENHWQESVNRLFLGGQP